MFVRKVKKQKKKTYSESDVGDRKEEEEWEEEVFDLHGQQFGAEFVSVAAWIYKYIVRNLRGTWQFDKVLRGGLISCDAEIDGALRVIRGSREDWEMRGKWRV